MHCTRHPWLALAATVVAVGCQRPAARTVDDPRVTPTVDVAAAPAVAPVPRTTHDARDGGADAGALVAASGLALERVAAVGLDRALAIGRGSLYRLVGDHWARVPLGGAEPRDVTAARGTLWVLARGTGENAGVTLVLRSRLDGELETAASPALGPASDPRVLAVAHEHDFYIGGASPPLVRVMGLPDVVPQPVDAERVLALQLLRGEVLVAVHPGNRASVTRWGEGGTTTVPDLLGVVAEPDGRGTTIHARGIFEHGRPGRLGGAFTTEAPFVPTVAGVLADGRPVVAGAGVAAVWQQLPGAWHAVTGPLPRAPVAVLPTEPPLIVGRDGMVVALDGLRARTVAAGGR